MKPGRQSVILEIISDRDIETQNQLMQALADKGIKSTQATLSRDIKDMRLIKELGPKGTYRYVAPAKNERDESNQKLYKIFKESVISCDLAVNLLVLKTLPGLASAACSALDGMEINDLVGTIAGDDTGFLAMRSEAAAAALYEKIKDKF